MRTLLRLFACCLIVTLPVMVSAQTPDEETPANEGVCDELMADDVTKGLYGLCVAFCEAQDCEATLDEGTGEVTFDPSCRPSNPKLLEKYNRRKTDTDPHMPCVNIIPDECPCWTEEELDTVADEFTALCETTVTGAIITGSNAGPAVFELAITTTVGTPDGSIVCQVIFYPAESPTVRSLVINEAEFVVCRDSITAECESRGF